MKVPPQEDVLTEAPQKRLGTCFFETMDVTLWVQFQFQSIAGLWQWPSVDPSVLDRSVDCPVLWVLWGTVVNTLLVKPRECWGRYVYTYICMYIYIYIILYIYIGFLVGWFWWVYPHVRSRKLWQRHQAQWPLCANVPQENLWGKGLVCWAGGPQIGSIFSIIQWLGPRNWPSPFLVGWWKLGNSNVPSGK